MVDDVLRPNFEARTESADLAHPEFAPPVLAAPEFQPTMGCEGTDGLTAHKPSTLFIACGALGHELVELKRMTGWTSMAIQCLPAHWHNTPDKIAPAVRRKIRAARDTYQRIMVLYGDCGTGGMLDAVLEEEGVERIPGPHCYQFFMGTEPFSERADREPGCFFLTDYLVRHFDRLILKGLGLDRFPQLLGDYFGNYTTLIYLAQTDDVRLTIKAQKAAQRLGLAFERRFTGYGELGDFVAGASGFSGPVSDGSETVTAAE
jgi:hypothetical protein